MSGERMVTLHGVQVTERELRAALAGLDAVVPRPGDRFRWEWTGGRLAQDTNVYLCIKPEHGRAIYGHSHSVLPNAIYAVDQDGNAAWWHGSKPDLYRFILLPKESR